jgi:hypothetical protein
MVTLPTIGQSAWGGPLNDVLESFAHGGFTPPDVGFLAWNYDPMHVRIAEVLTSGTVRMVRLPPLAEGRTITSLWFHLNVAAVTPTAGQCFAGLYNLAGTRLGVSADISGSLATTGLVQYNLTAPVAVGAGDYYAALLVNAATPPQMSGSANSPTTGVTPTNAGLPTASARVTNGPAAQTSLPASITMGSRTQMAISMWAGVK